MPSDRLFSWSSQLPENYISYLHEFVSSARMAAVEFFDNRELNVVDFSAWYKKFQLCFQIFAEVREMSAFLLRQRQWFP